MRPMLVFSRLVRAAWASAALGAGLTGVSGSAEAQQERPERAEDQVFFSLYGGAAKAEAGPLTHWTSGSARAELDPPETPYSWTAGYAVSWRPYESLLIDGNLEVFGLTVNAGQARFDRCQSAGESCCLEVNGTRSCWTPRTVDYDGFGVQWGPTVRGALPLRYLQLTGGTGLMLPVSFLRTQNPQTRLDDWAFEVGASWRWVAGVNGYVSRTWRLFAEYRFDYRLATIDPAIDASNSQSFAPLVETDSWLNHSWVMGFSFSPVSFRESPDKTAIAAGPFAIPIAGWLLATLAKVLQKEPLR